MSSPDTGYTLIHPLYLIWSRNASATTRAENMFAALRKKWPTKVLLDRNKINFGALLILQLLIKPFFELGLSDIK